MKYPSLSEASWELPTLKNFYNCALMVSGFCFTRILLTHKENLLKFSWFLPGFLILFLFGSSVKAAAIAN